MSQNALHGLDIGLEKEKNDNVAALVEDNEQEQQTKREVKEGDEKPQQRQERIKNTVRKQVMKAELEKTVFLPSPETITFQQDQYCT